MSSLSSSDIVRRLPVHFPSKRHLLSAARADGPSLSLLVSTAEWHAEGTPVQLDVSLGDCQARYALAGAVAFVPPAAWQRNGHQLAVRFQGMDKRQAAEMVAYCAGRPLEMGTSHRQRISTSVRCHVRTESKRLAAEVMDLSLTGAFVAMPPGSRLRVGDSVQLVLQPGLFGLGGTRLEARVLWFGEKNGTRGFGVRFLGDQLRISPALRKFLNS
ncbi:MAG: PilZ domain-containing protein [Myxococcaceae bacterium]|nr:PilZ domain-containing protein [Myxococcaceae bacterium]MCI0671370.1 PilZ domain-containing protein [Myxococcaceae bacterium]